MKYTTEFDEFFKKYAPEFADWQLFKAQAIVESNLNPDARSIVNGQPGAIGLMQIMPETGKELGFTEEELLDPEKNIKAGCEYMKQKFYDWTPGIDDCEERLKFAFASYNAGTGNIRKAQKYAVKNGLEAQDWSVVGLCLRKFTGDANTRQTVNYVAKIFRIHRELQEGKC